jgi:hypothetical protein
MKNWSGHARAPWSGPPGLPCRLPCRHLLGFSTLPSSAGRTGAPTVSVGPSAFFWPVELILGPYASRPGLCLQLWPVRRSLRVLSLSSPKSPAYPANRSETESVFSPHRPKIPPYLRLLFATASICSVLLNQCRTACGPLTIEVSVGSAKYLLQSLESHDTINSGQVWSKVGVGGRGKRRNHANRCSVGSPRS